MSQVVRVLIVDDHPLICEGIATVLSQEPGLEVCGTASGAPEALALVHEHEPGLCIVDLNLDEGSGLELIKSLNALERPPRILVSSMYEEQIYADRALRAGALGYLSKSDVSEKLPEAIRAVLEGRVYVSEALSEGMMMGPGRRMRNPVQDPMDRLSDREFQVFELIGAGKGTRDIADHLCVSVKTVETHRASIKRKLGIDTSSALVRFAIERAVEKQ